MAKSIRQGKMTAYRNLRGGGTEYLEMNSLDGDRPVSGWMNCPKCKHKDAHYLIGLDVRIVIMKGGHERPCKHSKKAKTGMFTTNNIGRKREETYEEDND